MQTEGFFYGIGVGPGEPGLIPVAAWQALQQCDLIFAPRASTEEVSVARTCLRGFEPAKAEWREVEFAMSALTADRRQHYRELAESIARELRQGKQVAYLTLGDSFTYSTYSYALAALQEVMPNLRYRTFPGVNSFAALASAVGWPLGEGKERVLILPCPDDMAALRQDILRNDVIVLMKVGKRLPDVLALLEDLGIASQCAFGKRVGLPDQVVLPSISLPLPPEADGYLSTMLIRSKARRNPSQPASSL